MWMEWQKWEAKEEEGEEKSPKELKETSTWKGVFGRTKGWVMLCPLVPHKCHFLT